MERLEDEGTRQFLRDLEGQAHSMALVYEQLYLSDSLSRVGMEPYLQQLTSNVFASFGGLKGIGVAIDAPISLDVSQAMPCGLIVNELLSNILKHAFPPDFTGMPMIDIRIREDGESCELTVADNGIGMPVPGLSRDEKSLGLKLVDLWATHQLGSAVAWGGGIGTRFEMRFRMKGREAEKQAIEP
ncbi:MAG: sensor histidine kinase, partial [Spirochaetota bacterium]